MVEKCLCLREERIPHTEIKSCLKISAAMDGDDELLDVWFKLLSTKFNVGCKMDVKCGNIFEVDGRRGQNRYGDQHVGCEVR